MTHTARTVRTLQAVAMTVGLALFLWSTGLPTFFRLAEAASITNASDILSNSAPGLVSNHTIAFQVESGMAAGQTITITFPAQFTIPGPMDDTDIDISASGTNQTVAATNGSGQWGAVFAGQVLTLTSPSNVGQASDTPLIIKIGTNATGGDQQITNPSATTSYPIIIGGTMPDSGEVRVAIVDQVTVSANVDTSLTFTVTGVNSSSTVNGSGTTTIATSTPTTLPFGTLPAGVSRTLAHDLAVTTNAKNGYSVTVQQAGNLQSSTGATINNFIDGTNTTMPIAWQAPSATVGQELTYGHWGLTSSDSSAGRTGAEFSSDTWVSGSTTPIAVMANTGPAIGTGETGTARVGYQIQISALQEAGDDYSTTLRYVVTPIF